LEVLRLNQVLRGLNGTHFLRVALTAENRISGSNIKTRSAIPTNIKIFAQNEQSFSPLSPLFPCRFFQPRVKKNFINAWTPADKLAPHSRSSCHQNFDILEYPRFSLARFPISRSYKAFDFVVCQLYCSVCVYKAVNCHFLVSSSEIYLALASIVDMP